MPETPAEWYVDSARQPVNLATIRNAQGVATKDVWRLVRRADGAVLRTRWARAGAALREYDVAAAVRVASTEPVPAERVPDVAPTTPAAGGASSSALIDAVQVARLDSRGTAGLRRSGGQAAIDAADATIVTQPWDAVPVVPGNFQVSGNRLFYAQSGAPTSTNTIGYVPLPENVPLTKKFRLVGGFTIVTGGQTVFLGLSFLDRASTAVSATVPDDLAIGLTTSGLTRILRGTNIGGPGAAAPIDQTPFAVTPGVYQVIFENDLVELSVTIRHTTDPSKTFTYRFPVNTFGANKAVGRVLVYNADTRGTAGYAVNPFAFSIGSRQPSRIKVVGGMALEGVAPRDLRRLSTNGTDHWRASLPASYDPRKPAPLAIHLHPAQSSTATADRPWTLAQERALSTALNDAGYIVAVSQDGYTLGNPNSDRIANDASMAEQKALIDYMRAQFAISEVVLYGPSMAGLTGLNLLARREVPNIAACYFIDGGCDLGRIFTATDPALDTFKAPAKAVYGVAADGSDWKVKTAGHDPMQREGWEFRGVPVRFVSGQSDPVAPPEMHAAFLDKIRPYAREASQIISPGAHVDPAHYNAADLLAFLSRHVA